MSNPIHIPIKLNSRKKHSVRYDGLTKHLDSIYLKNEALDELGSASNPRFDHLQPPQELELVLQQREEKK